MLARQSPPSAAKLAPRASVATQLLRTQLPPPPPLIATRGRVRTLQRARVVRTSAEQPLGGEPQSRGRGGLPTQPQQQYELVPVPRRQPGPPPLAGPRTGRRNKILKGVAWAAAAAVFLYATRNVVTPGRERLVQVEAMPMVEVRGGILAATDRLTGQTSLHTIDAYGNELSVQPNGDLYVEQAGSDGLLGSATYLARAHTRLGTPCTPQNERERAPPLHAGATTQGNVLNVPDSDLEALDRLKGAGLLP